MVENGPALRNLLEKILAERGFDFREYRESTLLRRIGRRLRFCGVETCEEYGCLLDRDPDEYDRLFNDLTINVSRFFRDRAAFDALAKTVLPNILESNQDRTVRIWSAGCARGEEAYSVCMLLHDVLGENTHRWNIQIQCTDLDPKAVLSAESGIFTQKDMDRVPSRFSEAFFTRREDDYVVSSKLKQSMRFCVHDLAKTPPFKGLEEASAEGISFDLAKKPMDMEQIRTIAKGILQGGAEY